MSNPLSLLDFALKYAADGWPVFPCTPQKTPLTTHGCKDASTDSSSIRGWWATFKGAGIGIACGAQAGFFVLDVDLPQPDKGKKDDGRLTLAELEKEHGALPETREVQTGSGGRHLYFKYPAGKIVRNNSKTKLGPGLDIRGEGGYVLAPPSPHESGKYYSLTMDAPIAEAPDWLLEKVCDPVPGSALPTTPPKKSDSLSAYAQAALQGECNKVAAAPIGTRNETLNPAAFALGQLVGGGVLGRNLAEAALLDAALACGLTEKEARKTIRSGIEAGVKQPRAPEPKQKRRGRKKPPTLDTPPPDDPNDDMPVILWKPEILPEILRQAETAILKGNTSGRLQLYQRGREVVHVDRVLAGIKRKGISRVPGNLCIRGVNADCLRVHLAEVARWKKIGGRSGEYAPCAVPDMAAKSYLAWAEPWNLPYLAGVVSAPTLRPDGSILDRPGYDEATGLYFDPSGVVFPAVSDKPSQQDALDALRRVSFLLSEFPFCDAESRAVALAAILTATIRRILPSAPLFAFTAPGMASGKTLLAHVVSLVATGKPCDALSYTSEENEARKRIFSILRDGANIVLFDNVEEPFSGDTLCAVLTSASYQDRVLGKSERLSVPTTSLWLATGNNLVVKGDLATRCLLCRIDPEVERPEERVFVLNLYEHIPEHRGELVRDVLTIMRAYQVAGCPDVGAKPFGRFEAWAKMVRNPLLWLGEADPVGTLDKVRNADPDRETFGNLLTVWLEVFGKRSLTTKDLLAEVGLTSMADALTPICLTKSGEFNPLRLGKWLGKHEGRIVNGLRLVKRLDRNKIAVWNIQPQADHVRVIAGDCVGSSLQTRKTVSTAYI